MRVLVPTLLRAYTGNEAEVAAAGKTVADVLADLEARYPGIRFRIVDEQGRIRQHMRIFVGLETAQSLETAVGEGDTVQIAGALSGG